MVYALLTAVLMVLVQPPLVWAALSFLSVSLLLSAELANSALERVVDLVSPHDHPLAGQAKDMAAGAVMLVSFCSAGILLYTIGSAWNLQGAVGVGFLLGGLWSRRGGRVL